MLGAHGWTPLEAISVFHECKWQWTKKITFCLCRKQAYIREHLLTEPDLQPPDGLSCPPGTYVGQWWPTGYWQPETELRSLWSHGGPDQGHVPSPQPALGCCSVPWWRNAWVRPECPQVSLRDSGLSCRDFCSGKEPTHFKERKELVRDSLLGLKDTKNSTRACWGRRVIREEASPLNHPRRVWQQSVNIPTGSIFSGGQGRPCPKRTEKLDFKDRQNHLKMHQNPVAP